MTEKVGLIAPNRGRVMEEEFPMAAPEGVTFLVKGLEVGDAVPERLEVVTTPPRIEEIAQEFAAQGVSLIVQCGTPVVFFKGGASIGCS